MTTANLIEIFCILDEFCKYFTPELKKHMVDTSGKRRRNRPCRLSDSEVMTILVLFHTMHFRDLKSFYLGYVCQHMKKEFPHTVSYNRFVERQAQVALHLLLFLQTCALGKCTGISIIDSTPLVSCHIKRMHMHKTMKGWAAKGKCTMGWFYGFKLHLVINDKAEIRCMEPYVHGQFTESKASPFAGRSHVHWLTGTASTVMVGCTEGICGIRPDADGITISPSIPHEWDGFRMKKTFRGKRLNIEVQNPKHVQSGVKSVTLNGKAVKGGYIKASALTDVNEIVIVLG